jgi:flagellar biosynthetic protein FliP
VVDPLAAAALPAIQIGITPNASPHQVAASVQILLLLTVLSVAPAVLILMTSFTRIVVVLSFVRSALAAGTMPPSQVLVGLALFLTLFVMSPVFSKIYTGAWLPYQSGAISQPVALQRAEAPLRQFMLRQTRTQDLNLFLKFSHQDPKSLSQVSLSTLVPAFVISELKTAFEIGFILYVPFMVIDMVVASTLMSMGMLMLPPTMISLPFKILLFVLVDGWQLVVRSLLLSFH